MIPLAVRAFGRGQVKRHALSICKSPHLFTSDFPPDAGTLQQVTLVAHQDTRHLLAQRIPPALLQPQGQVTEAGRIGHVEDQHDGMHTAIVLLHHALTESLLACRVP